MNTANNQYSLTIRMPKDMYDKLDMVSKQIGFTKVTFIRIAIYTYLVDSKEPLSFQNIDSTDKHRFALNVNQSTYDLLTEASELYSQSINSIVISLVSAYLEFFAKVLPELEL